MSDLDYDTDQRWHDAYDYAMRVQPDASVAMAFADDTGGDGAEVTIAAAWRAWSA